MSKRQWFDEDCGPMIKPVIEVVAMGIGIVLGLVLVVAVVWGLI
jgi:hypothetical protein